MKRRETGRRTGSLLASLDVICLLCWFLSLYFLFFYVFNAQAVFITSLQGGSASLQRNKWGFCFCQRGRGLVLDLWSHSTLRASHCSGPLFVWGLRRKKRPARGEARSKPRVSQGAAGARLPLNTLSPTLLFVLTGHTTRTFVRHRVHTDREGSVLDQKVRIFNMELKYLTHWHIPSICAERFTRDKEEMSYFILFLFC